MSSGSKKKKGDIDMGNYVPKDNERDAMVWCVHNGIFISPKAKSTTEWYVNIVMNGKANVSPDIYEKVIIWKQIYKFYVYYYDKYNGIMKPIVVDTKKIVKAKEVKEKTKTQTLF